MENEKTEEEVLHEEVEKTIDNAEKEIEKISNPDLVEEARKEFQGRMRKDIKSLFGVSYEKDEDVSTFLKRAVASVSNKKDSEMKAIYEKTLNSKNEEMQELSKTLLEVQENYNKERKERELADVINSIDIPKVSDYVDDLARKDMANYFDSKVVKNEDGSFTFDGELVIIDGKVSKDIKAVAKEVLKNKVEKLGVITTADKTKEARKVKTISLEDRRQSVRSEIRKYNYRSVSEEVALLYKNHNFNLSECPAWVQTDYANLFKK